MIKSESIDINKIKKEYEKFIKKYALPTFTELNKLFDIEEIDIETEFLLRRIRRIISDRIAGYLKFIEIILNPINSPIFFLKLIEKLDNEDRKILDEINNTLGKTEIDILKLDLEYSEKNEAEFIKRLYILFNEDIKMKFLKIADRLSNGKSMQKKDDYNRSYCG